MKKLLILLVPVLCFSCIPEDKDLIEKGILNLASSDSLRKGSVELKGDFAFFWMAYMSENNVSEFGVGEADEFIHVPGYWSPHVRGYGVYSVKILLPPDVPDKLALKMTNVLENYILYVNGKQVYQVGTPGTTMESAVRESAPALIPIEIDSDDRTLELSFLVSVWHDVQGGLCRNIYLGEWDYLVKTRERGLALDALIIGAVLLIGLYHVALFVLQRLERKYLSLFFLGLVFILIVLFIGSKNELLFKTVFEGFNADIRSKFIYSALAVSVPFFFCYINFIFPEYLNKIVFRVVLFVSSAAWLIIIFGDAAIFTKMLVPLEVFNLSASVYIISQLIYHLLKEHRFSIFAFLAGYILLVNAVVFSMLDNFMLVPSWSPGFFFLIFTVYQTLLQAYSTSHAYHQVLRLNTAFIEMEKETEKLYDLSYVDQLTSLANRRFLNEYMQKLWERNSMTHNEVGMIVIDIDFFKLYNDRYGHLAGDDCLIKVSSSLRESMNRKGDFVARYGGEEFVAVISNCPEAELFNIAERLRENIEKLQIEHLDSECSVYVTASAGIATQVPSRGQNWLKLFQYADEALYTAKKSGRNRIETYSESMSQYS